MTETRVAQFVRRAEGAVVPPDLSEIVARGRRLQRRRRAAVLAAAAIVGAGGWVAVADDEPAVDPVEDPRSQVRPYPGGSELPELEPGTYELALDREVTAATVQVTVPEGWRGWFGPNLPYLREGYAGLLVGDVERVAHAACPGPVSPMRRVGESVDDLVAALVQLPRHRVIDEPSRTTVDGLPAIHLVMKRYGDAKCPSGDELWDSPGTGGLIPAAGPESTIELWVVDLAGEAVLVSATTSPTTPAWARQELASIVASLDVRRG